MNWESLTSMAGVTVFAAIILLVILAILMPWYIYKISRESQRSRIALEQILNASYETNRLLRSLVGDVQRKLSR